MRRPGDPRESRLFNRLTTTTSPKNPEADARQTRSRPLAPEAAEQGGHRPAGALDQGRGPASGPRASATKPRQIHRRRRGHQGYHAGRPGEGHRHPLIGTYIRYFTLTHLYNAGLSDDELQTYRHGLAKLVNSLSWGRRVVVPQPDRPARGPSSASTCATTSGTRRPGTRPRRLPLRRRRRQRRPAEAVCDATGCELPCVRGDWFVAAAVAAAAYHDLLQLPATDARAGEAARRRRRRGHPQRAASPAPASTSSGVSRNNRLIERHESALRRLLEELRLRRQHRPAEPVRPPARPGRRRRLASATTAARSSSTCPTACRATCSSTADGQRIDKGPVESSATRSGPTGR